MCLQESNDLFHSIRHPFSLDECFFQSIVMSHTQAIQGRMDRLDYASLMRIQIFLGLGMVAGILVFGLIVVKNSSQCFISRQYLCQTSCLMLSIITLAFSSGLNDYSGYVLFAWMYGFFFGGYSYSVKMFVFEKVRARNFNRAWGFLQFSQSLPSFFGIPITSEYHLNKNISKSEQRPDKTKERHNHKKSRKFVLLS